MFRNNKKSKKSKNRSRKSQVSVSNGLTSLAMIQNPRPICPEKTSVVIRFQEYVALASGVNAYAYQTYSMNSPYDPLYSVGGGTCTGFTQWMTLYTRFYVTSTRITSVIYNGTANPILSYQLPLRSSDAVAGVTPTVDRIMEGKDSRYHYLAIGAHPANGRPLTVTFRPSIFEGLPQSSNREELSGDVSSDPVIQPAVQVGWFCVSGTTGQSLSLIITIEYTTQFWRPRLLGDV